MSSLSNLIDPKLSLAFSQNLLHLQRSLSHLGVGATLFFYLLWPKTSESSLALLSLTCPMSADVQALLSERINILTTSRQPHHSQMDPVTALSLQITVIAS